MPISARSRGIPSSAAHRILHHSGETLYDTIHIITATAVSSSTVRCGRSCAGMCKRSLATSDAAAAMHETRCNLNKQHGALRRDIHGLRSEWSRTLECACVENS